MAKIKEIKSTKEIGCMICQNPEISEIVDEKLIAAEMTPEGVSEHLEDKYGIFITAKDVENHKGHLFTKLEGEIDRKISIDAINSKVIETKNIDVINSEISKLEYIENKMIEKGDDSSPNFQNISKIKQKYIEMRMKIEGDDKMTITHEVPEWIKVRKSKDED